MAADGKPESVAARVPDSDVANGDALAVAPVEGGDDLICKKRGITRDYTPFLLILQGMTLQLQGISLTPF